MVESTNVEPRIEKNFTLNEPRVQTHILFRINYMLLVNNKLEVSFYGFQCIFLYITSLDPKEFFQGKVKYCSLFIEREKLFLNTCDLYVVKCHW